MSSELMGSVASRTEKGYKCLKIWEGPLEISWLTAFRGDRTPNTSTEYTFKVCLVGEGGVGKTSLIRRYVFDTFSDEYITTLGTKISKKIVVLKDPKSRTTAHVRLLVWDIMGQQGFRQMLQQAYFFGAQGIVGVCDNTRPETLEFLEDWIVAVHSVAGQLPIVFLGNKSDLTDERKLRQDELQEFSSKYPDSYAFQTSAKTGENVELAFMTIGEEVLKQTE